MSDIARVLTRGGVLSTVFQLNRQNGFVSNTRYTDCFNCLGEVHHDIEAAFLDRIARCHGFVPILDKEYPLPNGKILQRVDYRLA